MRAIIVELKRDGRRKKVQPKEILMYFLQEEEFDVSEKVKKQAANAIRLYVSISLPGFLWCKCNRHCHCPCHPSNSG